MTLIASFRLKDIPILIGDFLLTSNDYNNHNFIPTKPDLVGKKPAVGERRIYGTRKKIHIISSKLAIGFAGELIPGKYILRHIKQEFTNKTPSVSKLKSLLTNIKCVNKAKTEFTGWIIEKKPKCFYWKGKNPNELIITNCYFGGSGGVHFKKMLATPIKSGMSADIKTAFEKARYIGVNKSASILFDELGKSENLKYDYGFGSEIILWNGTGFEYNSKLIYVFLNIIIDDQNNLQIYPANVVCVYENRGEYSIMQVTHLEKSPDFESKLEAKNTYVDVITPIYDDMVNLDPKVVGRLTLESELWFIGISVNNSKNKKNLTLSIVSENGGNTSEPIVDYKNGMLYYNIKEILGMLPPEIFN
jgi:hypothetical protein